MFKAFGVMVVFACAALGGPLSGAAQEASTRLEKRSVNFSGSAAQSRVLGIATLRTVSETAPLAISAIVPDEEAKASTTAGDTGHAVSTPQASLVGAVGPGGTIDYSSPAVGELRISIVRSGIPSTVAEAVCTATLVRSDALITAAHCCGFKTQTASSTDRYYVLVSDPANSSQIHRYAFPVMEYRSLGARLGLDDLALVRLRSPVPTTLADPIPLAHESTPTTPTIVRLFGLGCDDRITHGGGGIKRSISLNLPLGKSSGVLCLGDSGGPVVLTRSGRPEIQFVNSAYWEDPNDQLLFGPDVFASVPSRASELESILDSWIPGVPLQIATTASGVVGSTSTHVTAGSVSAQ